MKKQWMNKTLVGMVLLTLVLGIQACKKKDNDYDNSNTPSINRTVDNAYDEMSTIADQAITGNLDFYKHGEVIVLSGNDKPVDLEKAACNVVITIDTVGVGHTVTVDWGTVNCDCNDGKQRRGKLVITFTGSFYTVGTVKTITPVGYYVNDNHIEGTKTVTNMGLNSSNQPYFNVQVNGLVTLTSGEVVTYTATRVRTVIAGYTTPTHWDNEYLITGSANASITNGNGWTSVITNPLHKIFGCGKFVSGTINFTPVNKPLRVIDYGTGTCDDTFTVTVNGVTYTIN